MNVVLSKQLPLLITAPSGIQKLRGLILELAVRGKLVPQDPEDEPASELLKKIAQERARLEAEGTYKRPKPVSPVGEHEEPFPLPKSWKWVRLDTISHFVTDGEHATPTRTTDRSAIPLVTAKNVRDGYVDYTHTDFVPKDIAEKCWKRCKPALGDILLVSVGATLGRLSILDHEKEMVLVRSVTLIRPCLVDRGYLSNAIRSPTLQQSIWSGVKQSAQPCLYLAQSSSLPIPLPPLAEQNRIVAKIDELMVLCDRLEAAHADAEEAHAKLVDTLLATLAQSTDAADLAANWQRVAEHFESFFTTESSIDSLKQTILQLAVIGKLVSQDPSDEPASHLLKRMGSARKIKRKVSAIDTDSLEVPLPAIPENWVWTVVDQVASDTGNSITDGPFGANLKTEHYIPSPGNRVIRLQNIGKGEFRSEHHAYIDSERFVLLEKHHVFPGDLIVAGLVDDSVRCCKLPPNIGNALVKADCYRFSVNECLITNFALNYLNSPVASIFAASHHHGMTLTRIGLGNFRQLPFPLPPVAEQHRIVAKVDELLTLCDNLKAAISESSWRQERLASTLIESALKAA